MVDRLNRVEKPTAASLGAWFYSFFKLVEMMKDDWLTILLALSGLLSGFILIDYCAYSAYQLGCIASTSAAFLAFCSSALLFFIFCPLQTTKSLFHLLSIGAKEGMKLGLDEEMEQEPHQEKKCCVASTAQILASLGKEIDGPAEHAQISKIEDNDHYSHPLKPVLKDLKQLSYSKQSHLKCRG